MWFISSELTDDFAFFRYVLNGMSNRNRNAFEKNHWNRIHNPHFLIQFVLTSLQIKVAQEKNVNIYYRILLQSNLSFALLISLPILFFTFSMPSFFVPDPYSSRRFHTWHPNSNLLQSFRFPFTFSWPILFTGPNLEKAFFARRGRRKNDFVRSKRCKTNRVDGEDAKARTSPDYWFYRVLRVRSSDFSSDTNSSWKKFSALLRNMSVRWHLLLFFLFQLSSSPLNLDVPAFVTRKDTFWYPDSACT